MTLLVCQKRNIWYIFEEIKVSSRLKLCYHCISSYSFLLFVIRLHILLSDFIFQTREYDNFNQSNPSQMLFKQLNTIIRCLVIFSKMAPVSNTEEKIKERKKE